MWEDDDNSQWRCRRAPPHHFFARKRKVMEVITSFSLLCNSNSFHPPFTTLRPHSLPPPLLGPGAAGSGQAQDGTPSSYVCDRNTGGDRRKDYSTGDA